MCKLTLTFGSSGKGLYGNTESTWQLHSVWMSFISMWPLIYLKSLFKIFLSKSIHTVFGLWKYIYVCIFISECHCETSTAKLRFQSILNVRIMDAFQSFWTNGFSLSLQIRNRIDVFAHFERKHSQETRISKKFESNFMNCVCRSLENGKFIEYNWVINWVNRCVVKLCSSDDVPVIMSLWQGS